MDGLDFIMVDIRVLGNNMNKVLVQFVRVGGDLLLFLLRYYLCFNFQKILYWSYLQEGILGVVGIFYVQVFGFLVVWSYVLLEIRDLVIF